MRLLPIVGVALCVGLPCAPSAAEPCMQANKAGEIQEGRLVQRTIGGERVYILQIPTPECLSGASPSDNVKATKTIQVISSDAKVTKLIARFAGKDVMVTGRAFGATSPSHKAPIVMDLTDIDQN